MAVVERTRFLVEPGAGELIWDGPIDTTVKVPTETTLGAVSITEMAVKPGYMVPPHTHRDTDEWSYVLRGRIGARVGEDEFTAEPGSWILKPRGLMHVLESGARAGAHHRTADAGRLRAYVPPNGRPRRARRDDRRAPERSRHRDRDDDRHGLGAGLMARYGVEVTL